MCARPVGVQLDQAMAAMERAKLRVAKADEAMAAGGQEGAGRCRNPSCQGPRGSGDSADAQVTDPELTRLVQTAQAMKDQAADLPLAGQDAIQQLAEGLRKQATARAPVPRNAEKEKDAKDEEAQKPAMDLEEELAVYKRRCDAASSSEDRDSVLREMLTKRCRRRPCTTPCYVLTETFSSTLGYPGEGPPGVGCECCPRGPAGRVQAKRPWAMDTCGKGINGKYRCLECCTFWRDANQADPTQETEAEDAVLPPLPPPPLPPPEPDATPLHETVPEVMEPPADVRMPGMDEEAVGMQDAAARGSTHGTATELLERTSEGALLLRALASPATETLIRIPSKAADRVATVLRDALRRAVDSQLAYVKKPTVAGRAEAAKAHRWLWVLPTLFLRVPPSGELANETMKFASARKRETVVTDRVKPIETDHAVDLLETHVAELEDPHATRIGTCCQPGRMPNRNTVGGLYGKLWTVASNRPKLPLSQDLRSREMS